MARQARLDTKCQHTHERRAVERPEARQTRLATDRQRIHERRAAEQPEARQARLERLRIDNTVPYCIIYGLHERNREQRAAEQPEARQARLERLRDRNCKHRAAKQVEARQAERQSEPQQTSMPALEDEWVQGKLTAFHAKMSSLSYCHCSCCNETFPSLKLTSGTCVLFLTKEQISI